MSCDIRSFTNTSKQHAGFNSNAALPERKHPTVPTMIPLPGNGRQVEPAPVLKHVRSGSQTPTSLRDP